MSRLAAAAALCLCVLALVSAANAAAQMRIVSLAPSVTETLFALGAGPRSSAYRSIATIRRRCVTCRASVLF